MGALIKPGNVKVITKEGEIQVSLTLDLNININADGLATIKKESSLNSEVSTTFKAREDKVEWAIPDFEDAPKIDFGKKK